MNENSRSEIFEPLQLYWWAGKPNFGDILSKHVVEYISKRPVIWSNPSECDLFAVGSILRNVRRAHASPCDGRMPWVWGSGSMGPHRADFVKNVQINLVRGPLTATLLGLKMEEFGDPGLLIADVIDQPIEKDGRIGLVPHHSQVKSPWVADALTKTPKLKLIDVRSSDALSVVMDIASCDYVLSSSLHGLIVADSFRVPNTWLNPDGIHSTARFKFYDYALSVKRILSNPVNYVDVTDYLSTLKSARISYEEGLVSSKNALLSTFPKSLVASK